MRWPWTKAPTPAPVSIPELHDDPEPPKQVDIGKCTLRFHYEDGGTNECVYHGYVFSFGVERAEERARDDMGWLQNLSKSHGRYFWQDREMTTLILRVVVKVEIVDVEPCLVTVPGYVAPPLDKWWMI